MTTQTARSAWFAVEETTRRPAPPPGPSTQRPWGALALSLLGTVCLIVAAFLAVGLVLSGCASPERAYVEADAQKLALFGPRIESSIDRDLAEGRIDAEQAALERDALASWRDRVTEAGGAVPARAPAPATPTAVPDAALPVAPREEREAL